MFFDFMEDVFGDLFENVTSGSNLTGSFHETVVAPMPEFDIGWDFEEEKPEIKPKEKKPFDPRMY